MAEVAALSMTVDSSSVVKATTDLDKFSAASTRAATASSKVGIGANSQSGSIAKLVAGVQSANAKLSAIVGSLDKVNAALSTNAKASQGAAAANDNAARAMGAADSHVIAYTQHLAALARTQQNANAHVLAYQANLAATSPALQQADGHVLAYRNSLNKVDESARKVSTAIKFTAQDSLNASRQLADIGVTAASGMSPFLIAVQQGPQLLDILQSKAAVTGQTLGTVFRAAAASVLAAAAPFLPLIALLALVAAGIAAITKQANDNSGLKKYTTEMGYTKEEVKKLNAVTVTFGDTTKAVFQAALASAAGSMGTNAKGMAKTWDSFLDHLVSGTRAALAGVYAAIAGTKAYLGEVEKGGVLGIGKMLIGQGDPDLIKKTYGKAYTEAQKGMDSIAALARKNAQGRQSTMAKGFYDAPKANSGAAKANPLDGILGGVQAEIEAEKTRAAVVGLSARAAAEMEERTKLLNQIQKAGIPITDALRAKVDALSKAYSDAKIAADKATALQGVSDASKAQSDAINDQLTLVGLYGDALIRARVEMEALARAREALPKGETLSGDEYARVVKDAKTVSTDQINLDRTNRSTKLAKDASDAAYAMDLEQKGLGLTGEAAIAYTYVVDKLNEAKRLGNELLAADIASINATGEAYAAQRQAIDQQREAMEFSRETAKGFFTDWINGVRNGESVFKSFEKSVLSALNKIIDKLLDQALNQMLGGGGGAGGGIGSGLGGGAGGALGGILGTLLGKGITKLFGGLFADGGAFGTAQKFANGGSFTNTIVNTPTLFQFANGSKFGQMGEAGPEAVMPLARGANGKLGVAAHGGTGGKRTGDVNVTNHFAVTGAIGAGDVAALVRQGGEQTMMQVQRNLQSMLQQLDTDGAFAG